MISRLKGKVVSCSGNVATVDVNGVGYEVSCSRGALSKIAVGSEVVLTIYTDVKETSIQLYGFEDHLEKEVFLLLKKVKGVGSKMASDMVSRIEKLELIRIIGSGDIARLHAIKGIGKKTAELILVELKEKVAAFALESGASSLDVAVVKEEPYRDAVEALKALGFSRRDAEKALNKVMVTEGADHKDTGEMVKEALRYV